MLASNGALPGVTVTSGYSTRKDIVQAEAGTGLTRGGRLRYAREAAGLSTKALADVLAERELAERSTATINRYEQDGKAASLEYVELLSELSGYSLDWIVFGRGDRGTAKDVIRRLRVELESAEAEYVNAEPTRRPLSDEDADKLGQRGTEAITGLHGGRARRGGSGAQR